MNRLFSIFVLFGLLAAGAATESSHASARSFIRIAHGQSHNAYPKESVLYSFAGNPDGQFPQARLMRDASGDLFGTTVRGGANCNCGTIFKLTPRGSGFGETVIYSATNAGRLPVARLFQDKSGNFFGSTERGGASGYGAVFKMAQAPSGGYSTAFIHEFLGKPKGDGAQPEGALISDGTNLFGTTYAGGQSNCPDGTVYELTPSYSEQIIHRFCGGLGSGPVGALILDDAGALYGTTQFGGIHHQNCRKGCGVIFKLTPSGGSYDYSVVYYFTGGSDGAYPIAGLLMDKSGALYGTTQGGGNSCGGGGCGTVFKLTPQGNAYTESILYRFATNYDGVQPTGNLVVDKGGVLYGTTTKSFGVNSCNCGTVYALTPSGSTYQESNLHVFAGGIHDGSTPYAGLVLDEPDRVLYGTTTGGGASNDGTVYRISL